MRALCLSHSLSLLFWKRSNPGWLVLRFSLVLPCVLWIVRDFAEVAIDSQSLSLLPTPLFISAIAAICIVTTHEAAVGARRGQGKGLAPFSPPPVSLPSSLLLPHGVWPIGVPAFSASSGRDTVRKKAPVLLGPALWFGAVGVPPLEDLAAGTREMWRHSTFACGCAGFARFNQVCTPAFSVSFLQSLVSY